MTQKVEKQFNLLDEPWIKVLEQTGSIREVGLVEFFQNAHRYTRMVGESRAQDFAVLRLLLAILHATFGRQEDGQFKPLPRESKQPSERFDMLDRWELLWNERQFLDQMISEYLEIYRDRFWLFHPERPFYQIPQQPVPKTQKNLYRNNGTYGGANKLNGTMSESSNKDRLFSDRANEEKYTLSNSEATRWLLFQLGFDDTAMKPVAKGRPGPGVGWLGKLGLVAAVGENLFETLMLNFVLVDGNNELWGIERPIWAREELQWSERTPVPIPDNASEILTLQSRWSHLLQENGRVTGFHGMGGHFYENDQEFFNEHMTLWNKRDKEKLKAGEQEYPPKRHDSSRALWRDLSALLVTEEGKRKAGVVAWIEWLQGELDELDRHVRFETAAVSYARGSPSNELTDMFSDSLSFSTALLAEKSLSWRTRILDEVRRTDSLVAMIRQLARDLVYASGGSGNVPADAAARAAAEAYYRFDLPFRLWLDSLEPAEDDLEERMDEWAKQAGDIALKLGAELTAESGSNALVGRFIMNPTTKKEQLFNSPRAYSEFRYKVRKATGGGTNESEK